MNLEIVVLKLLPKIKEKKVKSFLVIEPTSVLFLNALHGSNIYTAAVSSEIAVVEKLEKDYNILPYTQQMLI